MCREDPLAVLPALWEDSLKGAYFRAAMPEEDHPMYRTLGCPSIVLSEFWGRTAASPNL
jgi:hypothetical protein